MSWTQFSLRSALMAMTGVAVALGLSLHCQAAREESRRRQCHHHSPITRSYDPNCEACRLAAKKWPTNAKALDFFEGQGRGFKLE